MAHRDTRDGGAALAQVAIEEAEVAALIGSHVVSGTPYGFSQLSEGDIYRVVQTMGQL